MLLGIPDLLCQSLSTTIDFDSDAELFGLFCDFIAIVFHSFSNGEELELDRSQPQWEIASTIFNQNTKETLDGAKDGTVYHDWLLADTFGRDIFQTKAVGQVKIALNSRALPLSSNSVTDLQVNLGSVECPATLVN